MTPQKIIYLSNIEVPYRVTFFQMLAEHCDLTVVYERDTSSTRDDKWLTHNEQHNYNVIYLNGINDGGESSFSFKIIPIINQPWDRIIVGCYNSKTQILAMLWMRAKRIPFLINMDGDPFIGKGLKSKLKTFILNGASGYLTAGEKAKDIIRHLTGNKKPVTPYYFSSMTQKEIGYNSSKRVTRDKTVLVVAQYLYVKGLDVLYKAATLDPQIHYKIIGTGKRTDLFIADSKRSLKNVQIIPFLDKQKLYAEYQQCAMLVLPSRQECWGLVVNEAASFGTPIVSTTGSGAAMEFIADDYPQYLATPGDERSLLNAIRRCLSSDNTQYSNFLREKSKLYTIERNVREHLIALK